jgi:molybdopterin-binding protein
MQISARNQWKGVIKHISEGMVEAEVTVELAPGVEAVSVITKSSVQSMGLAVGQQVYVVVKSSDVMIGKP